MRVLIINVDRDGNDGRVYRTVGIKVGDLTVTRQYGAVVRIRKEVAQLSIPPIDAVLRNRILTGVDHVTQSERVEGPFVDGFGSSQRESGRHVVDGQGEASSIDV